MSDSLHGRTRPIGETTGTAERPAQHLIGQVLTFDLHAEIEQLHREEAWHTGDHNAKTLTKEPDLRIVLVAMKAGARLATHQTPSRVSIQALAGNLRAHLPDRALDLPSGHLVALEANVPHDVEALDESAFLLTVAWRQASTIE